MAEINIGTWLAGALGAMCFPLIWKLAKNRIIDFLVGYAMKELLAGLAGGDLQDADLKTFLHDTTLAIVKLAEAKIGPGLGAEKKAWVVQTLTKTFPVLKGHEAEINDFVETAVTKLNDGLKKVEATAQPNANTVPGQ